MVITRSQSMPILDADTPIFLTYFAEGAANVVFKIGSKRGIPRYDDYGEQGTTTEDGVPRIDVRLKGKLLRLRKDLASVAPVLESHQHFEDHIQPLFPADALVEQLLCKISPAFVAKCNGLLRQDENFGEDDILGRPMKRRGVYLAEDEPYATLVTDMRYDKQHASTEFKPKWLLQSPSAPAGSKRCRTCALRAMRYAKGIETPSTSSLAYDFCPLTLVSDDRSVLSTSIAGTLQRVRGAPLDIPDLESQLLPYFHRLPLLRTLRDHQAKKDPKGIFEADPSSPDFMTAMTIRDCTFFLKIPNRKDGGDARIEARLGDLDLKTSDGNKAEYWRETEEQLINE
ncbi:MAG: hypothetical protein Q9174_006219, partial [Haloplaca sp. 1 TL-2023]